MTSRTGRRVALWLCLILTLFFSGTALGHSGMTDAAGGHRDLGDLSGLGPYHYHCGGYPAHLHPLGLCPYSLNTAAALRLMTALKPAAFNPLRTGRPLRDV